MEEYLLAVANMQVPPQKMKTVLQFLGVNTTTEEEVAEYIRDPLKLMVLPKFIDSFANAANSPTMAGPEAEQFACEIKKQVWCENWVKFTIKTHTFGN